MLQFCSRELGSDGGILVSALVLGLLSSGLGRPPCTSGSCRTWSASLSSVYLLGIPISALHFQLVLKLLGRFVDVFTPGEVCRKFNSEVRGTITFSRSSLCNVYWWDILLCFLVIEMVLYLPGIKAMHHQSSQDSSRFRSSCSTMQSSSLATDLYTTQSSANSRTLNWTECGRSLMKVKQRTGPRTVP